MDLSPLNMPDMLQPKLDTDVDVVQLVHERLAKSNWSELAAWLNEPEIVEAKKRAPDVARFLVSRNLNGRLCGIGLDTRLERLVLNAKGPLEEYLSHMEQYVGPTLAKLSTPTA